MLDRKALEALGCWAGHRVERVEWPSEDSHTLSLYLKPVSRVMLCEQCGKRCSQIHETTVRRVYYATNSSACGSTESQLGLRKRGSNG
ncbi:hypothetical protein [Pandoraea communis]|uniref:hypothetical protein n=1 Tax=Pandoraea communis TaxID=2508297 RepID=UPI003570F651